MLSPCTAFPRPSGSMHFGDVAEVDLQNSAYFCVFKYEQSNKRSGVRLKKESDAKPILRKNRLFYSL